MKNIIKKTTNKTTSEENVGVRLTDEQMSEVTGGKNELAQVPEGEGDFVTIKGPKFDENQGYK